MNVDLEVSINNLYEHYQKKDPQWKGVEEYFSQEEIDSLKEKDDQNTELRFKQFAVQHYAMTALRDRLESYMSKAYLFQEELEPTFKDKYSTELITILNDLTKSGINFPKDQKKDFLIEQIENVKNTLKKNDDVYTTRLTEVKPIDYSLILN